MVEEIASSRRDAKTTTDNQIPPPTDPYVTYQTPYPRQPSQEVHNPFIEFRRLADSAFSSFFSGLPKLLGTENFKAANIKESEQEFAKLFDEQAKQFESKIAEMVRIRTEEAEGFQKQWEQMWEERRRENEQRINEENQRWEMMRRGLEKCPGLQPDNAAPQETQKYQPATELDLYEGSNAYEAPAYKPADSSAMSSSEKCPWKDKKIGKTCPWVEDNINRSWFSRLGYDGRRRAKNIPLYVPENQESEQRVERSSDWRKYDDEEMDPFNHDDHVVPWLKFSPYSPLALMDNETWITAFNQSRPSFDAETAIEDFPYDEAFEDLISLQKNGVLSNPIKRLFYWDGPSQWIADMAARGSLGEHWDKTLAAKRLSSTVSDDGWRGFSLSRPGDLRSPSQQSYDDFAQENGYVEEADALEDPDDVDKMKKSNRWEDAIRDQLEPQMLQAYRRMEDVALALFGEERPTQRPLGARGMLWPSPEEVLSALSESKSLPSDAEETTDEQTDIEADKSSKEDVHFSSSASTSSWTSAGGDDPQSLVSTLTTTATRTLPDGSVETKRTLKKSFADGTVEKSESTEIRPGTTRSKINRSTQTVDDDTNEAKQKTGWFWN